MRAAARAGLAAGRAEVIGLPTEYARYSAPTPGHLTVVRVRVVNRTGGTLYLGHCGYEIATRVEQATGRGWVRVPTGECPLVLIPAVAVAPGETHIVETWLGPSAVPPGGRLHGRCRIVLPVARSTNDSRDSPDLLPLAERTSQVFVIE